MKKLLSVIMVFALALSLMPRIIITVYAEQSGDYSYTVSESKATITDYLGDEQNLDILDTLGGYPVTSIGDYAFSLCGGLTNITIPDSITSIGKYAFKLCSGLTSITIPKNVTSIGDVPFWGCESLTEIFVNSFNTAYSSYDGALFNKTKTILYQYPKGKSGSFAVPNSVTSIRSDSFSDCNNLINVKIPDSVQSIGQSAFIACDNLKSVTIPNSVSYIGPNAFWGITDFTVYCYENSYAHTYAENNSLNYELILVMTSFEGHGCIIDYKNKFITGLSIGLTSLDTYLYTADDCEISYLPTQYGFGTGTTTNIIKDGEIVQSYTIIIFGDVNGDGKTDSIDAGLIVDFENYMITWNPVTNSAQYKASDINGDGNVDSIDSGILVDVENYMRTIDQSTGLA